MKVHFLTIVLDGMPWIPHHLPIFNTLDVDWEWHIVEGVASPTHCTKWCKRIEPRLSIDGTTEYIESIVRHSRVKIYQKALWDGKIDMVNAPLRSMNGDGLVWEVDADELWTKNQIEGVHKLMCENQECSRVQFRCRYYFGPDIVITSDNTYGNHHAYEWYRVWRWNAGKVFLKHEPPVMGEDNGKTLSLLNDKTYRFEHYAYATQAQVEFKERYYGYAGAVEQWKRLQVNRSWPAKLREFCGWVKDETIVERL